MSKPEVLVINTNLAKEQLKTAPQELQDYVKSLEASCERWSEINKEAVKKIKELSKK
jgi:hypothetical protein